SAGIYSVLESGKKFSVADMLALQTDIYSEWEHYSAERFAESVEHAKNPSLRVRQAADILRRWDGRMSADSSAPTIEAVRRGKFHPVEIQHPILGRIPLLKHWTGPGAQEQSGSGFTVRAVTRDHGPSERMTVDLSNFDQSTLNLVTGQAGNFLSPFYMDQWNA